MKGRRNMSKVVWEADLGNGYYRNLEKIMNNLEVIETAPFDRKAIKKAAEKKEKAKVTKKAGTKKTENKPAKEETEKND